MKIVFSDLDGTLLDHHTYSWEAARPAIERLRRLAIPWIMVTSKTRAETEYWRRLVGNEHPFVVENGAAAFIPAGYFPGPAPQALEWAIPYADIVTGLDAAAHEVGCRIFGFHQMSVEEVAAACDLPLEQAVLAKKREYDEPFRVLDAGREEALVAALEKRGLRTSQGGRFWHASGPSDKARAVLALQALYEASGRPVTTIGLGDAMNDLPFLKVVDIPVVVRSAQSMRLAAELPRAMLSERPGPEGWNEAVLELTGD